MHRSQNRIESSHECQVSTNHVPTHVHIHHHAQADDAPRCTAHASMHGEIMFNFYSASATL